MHADDDDDRGGLETVGATSLGIAFARAQESRRADRLFDDPYAQAFLDAAPGVLPDEPASERNLAAWGPMAALGRWPSKASHPGGSSPDRPFLWSTSLTTSTVSRRATQRFGSTGMRAAGGLSWGDPTGLSEVAWAAGRNSSRRD